MISSFRLEPFLEIGEFQIHLYGIVYALAFLAVFFVVRRYFLKEGSDPILAFSALVYLMIGTLLGARIFYVFYYAFPSFLQNPLFFFSFWRGGMSFHGGLFGGLLGGWLFCKKHKVDFLEAADLISIPLAFFLGVGRIVNFFNAELYGTLTGVPWCVVFPGIEGCRHPVQLYDGVKNFALFFLLIFLKKKVKKGFVFLSFVFFYSLLRFFIDFFRVYEQVYFGLGSGQYLNLLAVFISGYFFIKLRGQGSRQLLLGNNDPKASASS